MKPFAEACERNREPILGVLREWFAAPGEVLEIGAGTGQHAVYFAAQLPHLSWTCTDRRENLDGVRLWMEEAQLGNLCGPLELDVAASPWPLVERRWRYAFSANTAHIMSWPEVEAMFAGVASVLAAGGVFCLYGPFNRDGRYTSESNRAFDDYLKRRDSRMGVRDDQSVLALADSVGLSPAADYSLPANNRLLVFTR